MISQKLGHDVVGFYTAPAPEVLNESERNVKPCNDIAVHDLIYL